MIMTKAQPILDKATQTRYDGLIKTVQQVRNVHESSGWRLANLVTDAIQIWVDAGVKVIGGGLNAGTKDPNSATARVARDLGYSVSYVYHLRKTWRVYGDPEKRVPGLTFDDHRALANVRQADRHRAEEGLVQIPRDAHGRRVLRGSGYSDHHLVEGITNPERAKQKSLYAELDNAITALRRFKRRPHPGAEFGEIMARLNEISNWIEKIGYEFGGR